ncbi:MAG TPA: serine hydrolase domain-containing protein [Polyangiaceae bacterium]|nr:serine hydrolase domain-containing protein [Polyangiaceae bacterium]
MWLRGLGSLCWALALGASACDSPSAAPAATTTGTVSAPVSARDEALQLRLDAVLDAAIGEERIVGTMVIVARDGAVVYRRAAGFADREARRPVRDDTLFRYASLTKPLVSAAALALVDAGKLGLDDPVAQWLPAFKPRLADGRTPVITVRQLLTHTAGLTYNFFEREGGPYHRAKVSNGFDDARISLDENLARISEVPLAYEPGTRWGYSVAIDVLGGVVAKAGGGSLEEVVRRLVTEPLGMEAAFSAVDRARVATPYADGAPRPLRMADPQSIPYVGSPMIFSPSRSFDDRAFASGGAGMTGTAGDYLKFLEAIRTGGAPILKPETARAMTSNQIGSIDVRIMSGGKWRWGFGFALLDAPEPGGTPQAAGTYRWGGVYGNHFFVDPAQKLSVIVLTNTALAGMSGAFPDAVLRAVYGPAL